MRFAGPRMLLAIASAAGCLAAPAVAGADTTTSDNWSGYAAHGKGAEFERVSASWREPAGSCSGAASFSAFWVGLGGYSLSSDALEQIGTEFDCTAKGEAKLFAWYELVPTASRAIRMTVAAGDMIHAEVSVSGHAVTFTLTDRTRDEQFTRTIVDDTVDISSAEWIAEAPSDCASSNSCRRLPLADFGSIGFASAEATTTAGSTGSITGALWDTTRIVLGTRSGAHFVSDAAAVGADATPSALTRGGHAFRVQYRSTSSSASPGGRGGSGGPDGAGPGGPVGSGGGPPTGTTRNSR